MTESSMFVILDAFQKFKDSKGDFKESLAEDGEGMLSLNEAAVHGIRGEDIMDEALAFMTANLQLKLPQLNGHLAERRKSLNVETNFPYARDRIVERHFWGTGVYFEPQYSLGRKVLAKMIATASILDDTYDNYGTYEEFHLLTQDIQRWDIKAKDELPESMKMVYCTLFDLYNEIEEEMAKEEMPHATEYAKGTVKRGVRSALVEAKWRDEDYIPTMEEYMQVSVLTSYYPMIATTSLLGMGALATKDGFEWAINVPKIVRASATLSRLMDDVVSHHFEQNTRKHVASSIECYMKENGGASEEEVIKLFRKEITNVSEDINEECLDPTPVPMPILERMVNLVRAMDVIYKDHDAYRHPHLLKDDVASVLKDPILI